MKTTRLTGEPYVDPAPHSRRWKVTLPVGLGWRCSAGRGQVGGVGGRAGARCRGWSARHGTTGRRVGRGTGRPAGRSPRRCSRRRAGPSRGAGTCRAGDGPGRGRGPWSHQRERRARSRPRPAAPGRAGPSPGQGAIARRAPARVCPVVTAHHTAVEAAATSPSASVRKDTNATPSTPACRPASPDTNGRVGVCHTVIESHPQHGSENVTGSSSHRHPTVSTQHACEGRTTHPGWCGPSLWIASRQRSAHRS